MKRLLIVAPHFAPVSAPDGQRARMMLPYLAGCGWEAVILTVDPRDVQGVQDPFLLKTLTPGLRVVRVSAWRLGWTSWAGLRSLAIRSIGAIDRAGDELLSKERFDAVFFSTTLFPVCLLGPRWRRRHGVPYALDLQDPWLNDYDYAGKGIRPPGGPLKYGMAQWLARQGEPRALRQASLVVSVSDAYSRQLRARYPWSASTPMLDIPFGAPERDFALLGDVASTTRSRVWLYAGRGGGDMARSVRAFFRALASARRASPERFRGLQIQFLGTDYAPQGRGVKSIEPIAREEGVADCVDEKQERLPYSDALRRLREAEALIVPGSDDPGYSASKIYPYVLARRPMLAIFHAQSGAVPILQKAKAASVVTFTDQEPVEAIASRIDQAWFKPRAEEQIPATDWNAFAPYTARRMTERLCEAFDRMIEPEARP